MDEHTTQALLREVLAELRALRVELAKERADKCRLRALDVDLMLPLSGAVVSAAPIDGSVKQVPQ